MVNRITHVLCDRTKKFGTQNLTLLGLEMSQEIYYE